MKLKQKWSDMILDIIFIFITRKFGLPTAALFLAPAEGYILYIK